MKSRIGRILPKSRRARLVLAVLVLLVAGAGVWWAIAHPKQKKDDASKIVVGALKLREDQIKKLNLDSDNDGLRDWEETIFHTDANNPDTDGDGTKDGDEVTQGRDPLIKGPNDKIAPKEAEKKAIESRPNITSDFTQKFLQGPIAELISGGKPNIDPREVAAYTERLLNKSILSSAPQIKPGEIKMSSENTAGAIGEYFRSFSAVFLNLKARGENEIDVTTKAFQEQEYAKLEALDSYIKAYDKAIAQIKALPVPAALRDFHIGTVNYLSKFKLSVELMRNAENDPIQAMFAVHERIKLHREFEAYLNEFETQITAALNQVK